MTTPLPSPPPLVRARLRLRWARRRALLAAARTLREVAERLDPPAHVLARARAHRSTLSDRAASQQRHPSVTGGLVEWHGPGDRLRLVRLDTPEGTAR